MDVPAAVETLSKSSMHGVEAIAPIPKWKKIWERSQNHDVLEIVHRLDFVNGIFSITGLSF